MNLYDYFTKPQLLPDYAFKQEFDVREEVDNCLHKNCPQCHGNGVKQNGEICIHMISCPCPRCTPRC